MAGIGCIDDTMLDFAKHILGKPAALVAALLLVSGCTSIGNQFDQGAGAAPVSSGPAVGRELLEALEGGLVGRLPTLALANGDRSSALAAEYRALEYTAPAQPVYWSSQDQRVQATVIPSQPYRVGTQDCRQYTLAVQTSRETMQTNGIACRNENGSWSLVS